MAINLQDIRTAVHDYLATKVTVSISALTPAVPGTLNPNEEFTFSVTATNAATTVGGIKLINVKYHLKVTNSAVAKLIVPPATTAKARNGPSSSSDTLTPGTQVTEMFLFPVGDKSQLAAGETDTISGLKGKSGVAAGNTQITLECRADPDLDFLFPKNENSAPFPRTVNVV